MTPMPETTNYNQRADYFSIKKFIESPVSDYEKVDSVFPKDEHNLELLLNDFGVVKIDELPLIEASYTTEHGKYENRVFSVPNYPGIFLTQQRENSNGRGFEHKVWAKTIIRKLGKESLNQYLESISR